MQPNGTLALASDRVLADLRGERPGVPDGMKVDVEGNIYCGGSGGVWVLDPGGKHLGTIVHGAPATTNVGFGGDDWKTLFITTRNSVALHPTEYSGHPSSGWGVETYDHHPRIRLSRTMMDKAKPHAPKCRGAYVSSIGTAPASNGRMRLRKAWARSQVSRESDSEKAAETW